VVTQYYNQHPIVAGAAPQKTAKLDADNLFVNNVRFWSMVAIIAVHSLVIEWETSPEPGLARNLQLILLQILKFGTIGFYLSAGFLLGERLPQYSGPEYFLRRLKRVGTPWALWATLFALLPFTKEVLLYRAVLITGSSFWSRLGHRAIDVLFYSNYWFVPNFLIALGVLLLFKRYLDRLWFGGFLLCLSLFYGVNIYHHWVPSRHTAAIFGFVFYLWLGNWVSRNFQVFFPILQRVRTWPLLVAIAATGGIAIVEAYRLNSIDPGDMMNTLRISNQVFSLLVVFAFLKIPHATWPRFINVRATTFGLYLIHPTLGLLLHALVFAWGARLFKEQWTSLVGNIDQTMTHPLTSLSIWAVTFMAYYGGSLALTQTLARRPGLKWTVGQ
jgi:membrane-bound acyltransferase YfiQ involved in biofilm formation